MGVIIFSALGIVVVVFFRGHRKVAAALAAATLAVGAAVYYLEQRQDVELARRVAPSEVTLRDVTFSQTFRSSYDLRGKVTNKSETYSVHGIDFTVTLKDCRGAPKPECVEIGRTTASASVYVPPKETQEFTASMYFGSEDIKPRGKLEWEYEIVSVMAKKP